MISPADLNTMYWELLNHPAYIAELSSYQKSKLREYAEGIEQCSWDTAEFLMEKYPNYNYPEAYRNGREMEHFMERMSTAQESRFVLRLLEEKPAATQLTDQLTFGELALLYIYTNQHITGENAKDYLEGDLTSGDALYNKYSHYSTLSNRIGFADETAKKRENMIARIQKVLPRLTEEQRKRPESEIDTLKAQNQ